MKNVAIVGFGYVGRAVCRLFQDHYKIMVYDPFLNGTEEELTHPNVSQEVEKDAINSCDLAIVCVPTPQGVNGEVDLSIIKETIDWLNTPLILIKSTVPPTTTENLAKETGKKIAFSPEFIGEGKYVVQWWKERGYAHPTDMKYHDFQIFGGDRDVTSPILEFFKKIYGPSIVYAQTDSKTAELCKYMENSWGATKVIFCNEFAKIAEAYGIDYDELRELFLLDGRVEKMHTAVFKDRRGFGGKCFPKDVSGIISASSEHGYTPELLKAVLKVNNSLHEEEGGTE